MQIPLNNMNKCKNCGIETKNSNYCSRKCYWNGMVGKPSNYVHKTGPTGRTGWSKGLTMHNNKSLMHSSLAKKGRVSPFKGKTYEQIYGAERGREMRSRHSGINHGMFGKTHSFVAKKAISNGNKKAILEGRFRPMDNSFKKAGFRKDLNKYFRSSWEANFVRLLNKLGVKWEYEKYRFDLGDRIYIPDFYLVDKKCFVEITGIKSEDKIDKMNKMARLFPEVRIVLLGEEKYNILYKRFCDTIPGWESYRNSINGKMCDTLV